MTTPRNVATSPADIKSADHFHAVPMRWSVHRQSYTIDEGVQRYATIEEAVSAAWDNERAEPRIDDQPARIWRPSLCRFRACDLG